MSFIPPSVSLRNGYYDPSECLLEKYTCSGGVGAEKTTWRRNLSSLLPKRKDSEAHKGNNCIEIRLVLEHFQRLNRIIQRLLHKLPTKLEDIALFYYICKLITCLWFKEDALGSGQRQGTGLVSSKSECYGRISDSGI